MGLMLKRRLKDAGLPDIFSPHSFRVLVVTDLLSEDVPLEDVQYLAGHATPGPPRSMTGGGVLPGILWRGFPCETQCWRSVLNVSWEDALAFTEWLSSQTGKRNRLPTEAEWEYAARAGSERKFHFGDDLSQLCRYANHREGDSGDDWGNKACSDGVGKGTATAGSYLPNAFGLYDMLGNVQEWVQDCWNGSYRGAPADGSAWLRGDFSRRVYRSSSWQEGRVNFLRVSSRGSTSRYSWQVGGVSIQG